MNPHPQQGIGPLPRFIAAAPLESAFLLLKWRFPPEEARWAQPSGIEGRVYWTAAARKAKVWTMGDGGFQYLDILLLGAVAGFIVLRLRAVLGQRSGFEQKRREQPLPDATETPPAPEPIALPEGPLGEKIAELRRVDPSFNPDEFVQGARQAYEMIVQAFAAGDKQALKSLLSREVFADFEGVIDQRAKAGQRQETTFVGIDGAEITDIQIQNRIAEVTLTIRSELINVTRDKDGQAVAGDPNAVQKVTDIWTFARDTRSRDPNWTLIGTAGPA